MPNGIVRKPLQHNRIHIHAKPVVSQRLSVVSERTLVAIYYALFIVIIGAVFTSVFVLR
jgi:hypothetical protein